MWARSIFWISCIVIFGRKFGHYENLPVNFLESCCSKKEEKDEIEEEQFEGLEL